MKQNHSFQNSLFFNKCRRCGKPAAAHFDADTGAPEWLVNSLGLIFFVIILFAVVGLAAMFGGK